MKAQVTVKDRNSEAEIPEKYYFPIINCPGDISVGDIVSFEGKVSDYYPGNFVVERVHRRLRHSVIKQWWEFLTKRGEIQPWYEKIDLVVSQDLDKFNPFAPKKILVKVVVTSHVSEDSAVEEITDFFRSSVYEVPRVGEFFEYEGIFLEVVKIKHRPKNRLTSIVITLRLPQPAT